MKRSYIALALGGLVAIGAALCLPSCGHDQKLVSLTITPSTATYLASNAVPAVFQATGTYIHPPETKNITGQVTWATDVPQMLLLSYQAGSGEMVGPNGICGIANISATAPEGTGGSGNIVVGYATLTIDGTGANCPGSSSTDGELVVTPAGTGVGTVSSNPTGINCPGTACGALFPSGESITLDAAAGATSTFAGWVGCTASPSDPSQCTVTIAGGSAVNVTATFNSP
jgi:hypothetical protein